MHFTDSGSGNASDRGFHHCMLEGESVSYLTPGAIPDGGKLARTIREDLVFAHSRPQERSLRSGGFRRGACAPCSRLTRANPERRPANAGRSRSPEGG